GAGGVVRLGAPDLVVALVDDDVGQHIAQQESRGIAWIQEQDLVDHLQRLVVLLLDLKGAGAIDRLVDPAFTLALADALALLYVDLELPFPFGGLGLPDSVFRGVDAPVELVHPCGEVLVLAVVEGAAGAAGREAGTGGKVAGAGGVPRVERG